VTEIVASSFEVIGAPRTVSPQAGPVRLLERMTYWGTLMFPRVPCNRGPSPMIMTYHSTEMKE